MRRVTVTLAAVAVTLSLHAQSAPQLVRDITHALAQGSEPRDFVSDGRTTYFFAWSDDGRELWKTDGTRDGTRMVADLAPGVLSLGHARMATISGDYVYFWADPDGYALNLFRSDGTPSGTIQLTDFDSDNGGDAVPFGTHGAIFTDDSQRALYVTDGTPEGTTKVIDTGSLANINDFHYLVAWRGDVYFATDGALWRTDGTAAGTRLLAPITSGSLGQTVVVNGALYIVAGDFDGTYQLWRSDGTASGTRFVRSFVTGSNEPPRLQGFRGSLYLLTYDGEVTHLWKSDGTGIAEVATVNGGFQNGFEIFAATDSYLYFSTSEPSGETIWRSDGTPTGTTFVAIFQANNFTWAVTHDALFISQGYADIGLWSTTSGAMQKISPSYFPELIAAGNVVIGDGFDAEHGEELWTSNGTPAGTRMVANIAADNGSFGQRTARLGNDRVLFAALDEDHGFEPWVTDGTPAGTHLLADVNPGSPAPSNPTNFTDLTNGNAVFIAQEPINGREMWTTDGTTAGTHIVRNLAKGAIDAFPVDAYNPTDFPVIGGRALFSVVTASIGGIWSTDGTFAGTSRVKSGYLGNAVVANGNVYAGSSEGFTKTDGTVEGTIVLAPNGQSLAAAGSKVFFDSFDDAQGHTELWVTDGTPAGTKMVKDIYAIDGVAVGGSLFFFADDGEHGRELWCSDGTEAGTRLVKDLAPGPASSYVNAWPREQAMAAYHGLAYFVANDGVHGAELWRSDGTPQGTFMVRDVNPGVASSTPVPMTVLFDRLYFGADDGVHGRELWSTDGASMEMVSDLNPGPASSAPRDFIALGDSILFFATRDDVGRELWKIAPLPGPPSRMRAVR
jgi:ELWxxDGT repeat protein